jgi:hypothetical protein
MTRAWGRPLRLCLSSDRRPVPRLRSGVRALARGCDRDGQSPMNSSALLNAVLLSRVRGRAHRCPGRALTHAVRNLSSYHPPKAPHAGSQRDIVHAGVPMRSGHVETRRPAQEKTGKSYGMMEYRPARALMSRPIWLLITRDLCRRALPALPRERAWHPDT